MNYVAPDGQLHITHPLDKYFQIFIKRELSTLNPDGELKLLDAKTSAYLALDSLVDYGSSSENYLESMRK